jgi:hypothetical protein
MLCTERQPHVDLHGAHQGQAEHLAELGGLVSTNLWSPTVAESRFICNRKVITMRSVPGSKAMNKAPISYTGRLAFGVSQNAIILQCLTATFKLTADALGHWKRHLRRLDCRDEGKCPLVNVRGVGFILCFLHSSASPSISIGRTMPPFGASPATPSTSGP